MKCARYFCPILNKFRFSEIVSYVYNEKFHCNLSSERRVDVYELSDGHEGNWLLFLLW